MLAVLVLARGAGGVPGLMVAPLFETWPISMPRPASWPSYSPSPCTAAGVRAAEGEQMVMSATPTATGHAAPGGELGALPGPGVDRPGLRPHGSPHALSRPGRQRGPWRRPAVGDPGSASGTVRGRFRVTEQGETIASRYSDHDLAHRHHRADRERGSASPRRDAGSGPGRLAAARDAMASAARESFRARRAHAQLSGVRRAATAHREISRLRLGSRARGPVPGASPARMSGASPGVLVDAEPCNLRLVRLDGAASGRSGATASHVRTAVHSSGPARHPRCRCSRPTSASRTLTRTWRRIGRSPRRFSLRSGRIRPQRVRRFSRPLATPS